MIEKELREHGMTFGEKVRYARMRISLSQELWQRNSEFLLLLLHDGRTPTENRKP